MLSSFRLLLYSALCEIVASAFLLRVGFASDALRLPGPAGVSSIPLGKPPRPPEEAFMTVSSLFQKGGRSVDHVSATCSRQLLIDRD